MADTRAPIERFTAAAHRESQDLALTEAAIRSVPCSNTSMQTRKVAADVKPTVAVVDGDLATLVIKHQAMSLRLNLVARNRGKRGMHTNLYEARRQRGRDSGCQCRDFKVYTRQLWKPSARRAKRRFN